MGPASGTRTPSRRRGADFGVRDDVGSRIRTHREESNLSLRELARRLGISPSAVSQIETGKSRPSVNTLYAVIDELGLSVDDLFSPLGPAAAPGSAGAAVATSRRWPVGLELREDVGRRIRAHREETNLSLRELARRLGISPSAMSQIETGKSRPSVSTLYAVIDELGLAVDELFGPIGPARVPATPQARTPSRTEATHDGTVQRRKSRAAIEIESGVRWERLTPGPDDSLEFVHMTYGVGGASTPNDRFVSHAGREYGVVIHGTLEVGLGFDTYRLEAGDSIRFESTVPHLIRNVGREPATCIWCVVGERDADEPPTAV